jgi:hypothetical protein
MAEEIRTPADRSFDLSLRVLTIVVMVGLAACIGFLAYLRIERFLHRSGEVVAAPVAAPAPAPPPAPVVAAKPDEVLMAPNRVFRCLDHGKMTFSDKACPPGTEAPR